MLNHMFPSAGQQSLESGYGLFRYEPSMDHNPKRVFDEIWHAFSGLDMAIFADAGKVALRKADLDFTRLED